MSAAVPDSIIADVRQFNRFYTRTIGVLGAGLLDGEISLAEARVLYEIANGDGLLAADLVKILGVDFGYLSRILAAFDKRGWLKRQRSESDARKSHLTLTAKGRKVFATLNQQARDEVAKLLQPLPLHQQQELQTRLRQVQSLLSPEVPMTTTKANAKLRTHRAGDMGWIIQRHGALYEKEYGYNSEFEALVAEICAKFLREFDASRERCWIAELGDIPVGTIMLVRGSDNVAKLRLLLVEDSARGHGVGRLLVQECIEFARQAGYRSITLWTQSNLFAARKLYEAAGFRCVNSEAHTSFGQSLVAETWSLDF